MVQSKEKMINNRTFVEYKAAKILAFMSPKISATKKYIFVLKVVCSDKKYIAIEYQDMLRIRHYYLVNIIMIGVMVENLRWVPIRVL